MALKEPLSIPEAHMGLYNGVETALAFTSPAIELRTLQSACGVFGLGWRAKIAVAGADRVRWLNGMVTNNIRELPVQHGCYNFLLNPQGRILGDLYAYNRGESLLLDTDRFQLETIMSTLRRYIIMDKVEMTGPQETFAALGVCGPKAEEVLKVAGLSAAGLEPLELREAAVERLAMDGIIPRACVVRGPAQKPGWHEIWVEQAGAESVWNLLLEAGAQPVGTDALEWWRILQGIPRYGQDIRERDLPQETGQDQALNFSKGCYIGQEIVERIRSRGQVHRKFTGFQFHPEPGENPARDSAQGPATGAALSGPRKFEQNGRLVAEITSAAQAPADAGGARIALGYVRNEAVAPDATVELDGKTADVVHLPFQISMKPRNHD